MFRKKKKNYSRQASDIHCVIKFLQLNFGEKYSKKYLYFLYHGDTDLFVNFVDPVPGGVAGWRGYREDTDVFMTEHASICRQIQAL